MNTATAKITVENADQVIAYVDKKLSEVSYLQVKGGYVEIPLDFNDAVAVLTPQVCNLVIEHFKGEGYSDTSITLKGGVKTLRMKSPIYE